MADEIIYVSVFVLMKYCEKLGLCKAEFSFMYKNRLN